MDIAIKAVNVAPGGWSYGRVDFLNDSEHGWCIIELEMLEPSLFFRHCPKEQIDRLALHFAKLALERSKEDLI